MILSLLPLKTSETFIMKSCCVKDLLENKQKRPEAKSVTEIWQTVRTSEDVGLLKFLAVFYVPIGMRLSKCPI